nr:putative acyltransferase [uncultured bacterium]
MSDSHDFRFETAPELPGSDRLNKYISGGLRLATDRLWDFTVEGRDNVPTDGGAVITPNHLSFCDSVFVPAALPRRVWAIGKGEYMDSWKTKHLFPAMGMIPVDRSGGDAAKAALDTAARVLDDGRLFMIYPEGTRSRSGHLHKGRTGAARLSIRCNAPVVPVGHEGTLEVQPPDAVMMKPRRPVTVRFGKPMWAHEFGDPDDPRTLRAFTDAVMFEIAQLSGQIYVDRYASKDDKPGDTPAKLMAADSSPKPAAPSAPTRIGVAAKVGRAAAWESDEQRVTTARPSVIGDGPASIPRPPSRQRAGGPTSITSVSGTDQAVAAIARPPGRHSHVG